jgi:hypothetical protein
MATAVIGGLIAATLLSLVFVPSFYIVMDDMARLFGWMFSRFIGKKDEPRVIDPDVAAVESKVSIIDDEIEDLAAKLDAVEEKLAKLGKPSATVTKFKPAAE